MSSFQSSINLLIGQWQDSPVLKGFIEEFLDMVREQALPAIQTLKSMREIETAEGVFLDALGTRLGVDRPATTDPTQDVRFGFDAAGLPFDQAPFRGDAENDAVYPLPDSLYRSLLRARAILDLGNGSIVAFNEAILALDPGASVQDRRNMNVRIVTAFRFLIELADSSGALPRAAGVRLVYQDRGRFGYDDSGTPFDQGAWTP